MKRSFTHIILTLFVLSLLSAPLWSEDGPDSIKAVTVFSSSDTSNPLLMRREFLVSKFGRGSYRIDGPKSYGRLNCIFLFFETAVASQGVTTDIIWTQSETESDGNKVLRNEAVLVNPFPRKDAAASNILRMRVDAANQEIRASLSKVAEEIVGDSIKPIPESIPREMF